jgi:hypothetical protein
MAGNSARSRKVPNSIAGRSVPPWRPTSANVTKRLWEMSEIADVLESWEPTNGRAYGAVLWSVGL